MKIYNPNRISFSSLPKKEISLLEGNELLRQIIWQGTFILMVFLPWVFFFPSESQELSKQFILFGAVSFLWMIALVRAYKRGEVEWKRSRFTWVILLLLTILGVLFVYSKDKNVAWNGYSGIFTAGVSEYIAFFLFYFLGTQFFSGASWKNNLQFLILSLSGSMIFLMIMAYFGRNDLLESNFAKTPSLVAAAFGITSLSLWWTVRTKEKLIDWFNLFSALALFFVSSILDFSLSWWVWVAGTGMILVFDLFSKLKRNSLREDQIKIGMYSSAEESVVKKITAGKGKYLFFIFFFSLSQAISPLVLQTGKFSLLPFYDSLYHFPILLNKIIIYILIELVVIFLGIYYFWKEKTENKTTLACIGSLSGILMGQVIYYSESTLLYLLIWSIFVLSSLTFLRKKVENDYLRQFHSGNYGKTVFMFLGVVFIALLFILVFLRGKEMF